jgi:hypothetical protein
MDLKLIDEIRNVLFGVPHGPGTDLAARDIQRARDHGIGSYNQVRKAFGLAPVTSYRQITHDPATLAALKAAYGPDTPADVAKIDPFEGMLAEDHIAGTDAGPTESAIVLDQFRRLMLGDRFFFLNETFNTEEQALLAQGNTLAKILKNNTEITNLQSNVFFFTASISGTVYLDLDNDGNPRESDEPGLPSFTVHLNDNNGNSIATTTTNSAGHYNFTDLTGIPGTGKFTVSIDLPSGFHLTSAAPGTISLSRGGLDVDSVNFGVDFDFAGSASAEASQDGTFALELVAASTNAPAPTGSSATIVVSPPKGQTASSNLTQIILTVPNPGGSPINLTLNEASFDEGFTLEGLTWSDLTNILTTKQERDLTV